MQKGAKLTEDDAQTGTKAGDIFTIELFERLFVEENEKLLKANSKDVFDESKTTTLPISKEIAMAYVLSEQKFPWFIDFLNINLNNLDLAEAKNRISRYMDAFTKDGIRITENLDFKASWLS